MAGDQDQPGLGQARWVALLAGAAVVLTAFNLRPAVTSLGALLPDLRRDIGMPPGLAGLVTTLPPICFGLFGLLVGRWARRRDTALVLVGAMVLTAVSLTARAAAGSAEMVLLWTVPALAGMGAGNILLPVAVKRWFPRHVGRATGLYTMSLAVGTALAAAGSVPIAQAFGSWRAGLGAWAIPPLLAVPVWLWVRRRPAAADRPAPAGTTADPASRGVGDAPDDGELAHVTVQVHRQARAWALVGYFGIQSLGAYVVMGWLPTIYQDAGLDPTSAGLMLAIVTLLGAPIALVLPVVAARRDDQRPLVVALGIVGALAYTGLLVAPATLPALWAVLLGIGQGAFPLALVLIGLRARGAEGTARLSALTQGVGYLIAAGGPIAIGLLAASAGSWTPPLLVLTALLIPQVLLGLRAASPGFVD